LRETRLKIAGEHHQRIVHALIGKASDVGVVRTVYGHPQALRQAQRWLNSRPDLQKVSVSSTTRALERALDEGAGVAAVASPDAARLFGLNVIEPNISDFAGNETRFVLAGGWIRRQPRRCCPARPRWWWSPAMRPAR
jgi:chorismate mutase / prephenate dehydratase